MRRGWCLFGLLLAGCVGHERPLPRPAAPTSPARIFTVRAWVDLDYRDQVVDWHVRVASQVARASARTRAALNVELKLVSIEPWDHRGDREPLEAALGTLERRDGAGDADLALGFVSGLPVLTDAHEKLGLARLLGRHAVLRAVDAAEEATLLLHEWAHVLGAPHDLDADSLLTARASPQRTQFAQGTLALLASSLAQRDAKVERPTLARSLAARLRGATPGAWEPEGLEATLTQFDAIAAGQDAQSAAALHRQDRARFDEVTRLTASGLPAEALEALRPLLDRTLVVPDARSLACQLSGTVAPAAPETKALCLAAAAASPGDGHPGLMLAQAQAATGDLGAARAHFVEAHRLLSDSAPDAASLAKVARSLGFVTWAEASAARAVDAEVAAWAQKKRRWFGLPAGTSAPAPADEPAYLERFVQAQGDVGAGRLTKADVAIRALEQAFPALPGPLGLRCELFLRRVQNRQARTACASAAAAYPDSLQAHYLLGLLDSLEGQHRDAAKHFELVLQGDPTVEDARRRLSLERARR